MLNRYDRIDNTRPNSKFASYEPQNESQKHARSLFQSIADDLVENRTSFQLEDNPFPDGRLIVVTGRPGVGKSHLMEAVINDIKERAPELAQKIFFTKGTPLSYLTGYDPQGFNETAFSKKPIIFIDDLFANKSNVEDLCPATDIKPLMALISGAYLNRNIVVVNSNFPFTNGLLDRISALDKTGRVTSRCQEILTAHAGELVVEGADYRAFIAEQKLRLVDDRTVLGLGVKPQPKP